MGKRFFLHPVVIMSALMPEPVVPWSGAPQAAYSHHFVERGPGKLGFLLEVPPVMPLIAATVFPGSGDEHQRLMEQLPFTQTTIAICRDGLLPEDTGGTVKLRDPAERRVSIDYPLRPFHFEAFREACKVIAHIQLAAGAREVRSLHSRPVRIQKEADIDAALDSAAWEAGRVRVATAHQMGGCAMGADPRTFYGLSGVGDLVLTSTGPASRNHQVGLRLGQGERLTDILDSMQAVAEGVRTARAALGLAQRHQIDMPIVREVCAVLFEGKSCSRAVSDLMERGAKEEVVC